MKIYLTLWSHQSSTGECAEFHRSNLSHYPKTLSLRISRVVKMGVSEKDIEHETIEHLKPELSIPETDRALEKQLLWKLDIHVVPILMLLFLLAFLDRINIGNARLQGLEADLDMKGRDYNIALLIFFIPYILLEVPSNLILKKFAPSWWLSGIMFCWGLYHSHALEWMVLIYLTRCYYDMYGPDKKLWRIDRMSLLTRCL